MTAFPKQPPRFFFQVEKSKADTSVSSGSCAVHSGKADVVHVWTRATAVKFCSKQLTMGFMLKSKKTKNKYMMSLNFTRSGVIGPQIS